MTGHPRQQWMTRLRRAALAQREEHPTDADLLGEYVARRDPVAFEALLHRHGPMVLGVCRRELGNDADAEDAFQATFLVLIERASSVRPPGMVGNWLYGVARNTARKARFLAQRRRARERLVPPREEPAPPDADRLAQLDAELGRLSENYRAALVLCELEGKTIKEAARQLGWPEGTVATRLARGRALLARRMTVPAAAFAPALSAALVTAVARAAQTAAHDPAALANTVSPQVFALAKGVIRTMFLNRLKLAAAAALAVALALGGSLALATAAGLGETPAPSGPQLVAAAPVPPDAKAEAPAPITAKLSADKTEVKEGDLVTFTLEVKNTTDKAITLDVKPKRDLNTGYNALATGEWLRRVTAKDAKGQLQEPELLSLGSIEPYVGVEYESLTLPAGETKKLTFAAQVQTPKPGQVALVFDDPASPGLRRFGTKLSRSVWWFPFEDGTLTLRLAYARGDHKATSADVKLTVKKPE